MSKQLVSESNPWGLSWEKFFYYFMGLRKGELRKDIDTLRNQYPDDDSDQLARRVVNAQVPLSLAGGIILQIPWLLPGVGPALKLLGVSMGASVMVILNMTMLLQIALIYGQDIDDRARLKEMLAIIAASGLAGGASALPHLSALHPGYKALVGGTAVTTVSQLLGEAAIRYYRSASQNSRHVATT
ncbi:MAG: hypothetical protein QNJ78_16075 [Gammaproteobacteria bacterium]|nr:hypothetical protein [Gammaproteobacteria bacterium]